MFNGVVCYVGFGYGECVIEVNVVGVKIGVELGCF